MQNSKYITDRIFLRYYQSNSIPNEPYNAIESYSNF